MKIKGFTVINLPFNTVFVISLISLLPIFQTRWDIVAEYRLILQSVTFLVTGIWTVKGQMRLSEQGKLKPVRYIYVQQC